MSVGTENPISSNVVLKVDALSKSFREYRSEWQRVASWFGVDVVPAEEHTILNKVAFSIAAGESVGIVGQNGAGKSTLLKIITGTLKPSEGTVQINGRISAILELGMGFNPDLTGRENAYHAAGIMGFSHEQIDAVIEEIKDFSEIGDYFEQPVRIYSSGMQMRVAFGVATAYRPEILIIDEALSVGDAYFQHKSFEKIRTFQKEGTTLLLVSHDKGAIQAICNRAILLEKGSIAYDGIPDEVMDYYNALIADQENHTIVQQQDDEGSIKTVSGTQEVAIESVALFNSNGKETEQVAVGSEITIEVRIKAAVSVPTLVVGYLIKDRLGQEIFGTNTLHYNKEIHDVKSGSRYLFRFTFPANLGKGSYSVSIAAHEKGTHLSRNYNWQDKAVIFTVTNVDKKEFIGLTWIEPEVEVRNVG